MRRTVPLFIAGLGGAAMIFQYFILDLNWLGNYVATMFVTVTAFAYVLGAASLFQVNGRKIQRLAPGWQYNLILLLSLVITLYFGLFSHIVWPGYAGHQPIEQGTVFDWIFRYIYTPLSATTFSLLAFFIASASFRAFKARSIESSLLLLTALLVMIFRVPLGEYLWSLVLSEKWLSILLEEVITNGFNVAGQRAIEVAAAIGLISVSLKIVLGIERAYLGGE